MSTALEIGRKQDLPIRGEHSLARREMVGGLIRPVAAPEAMFAAQEETRELIAKILKKGRDYDKIPGTSKDTMLQPGAERTAMAFGLAPRFEIIDQEVDHSMPVAFVKRSWVWGEKRGEKIWTETPGASEGLYRYVVRCVLVHRESGVEVGEGIGSCSTMESKYIDRPRDLENTVLKMAKKRANVDAVLTTLGLHDQFTQDVEDLPREMLDERAGSTGEDVAACPKCGGAMWDNRAENDAKLEKDPNAKIPPDWKCKDKDCAKAGGLYWRGEWPVETEISRLSDQVRAMVVELRSIDEAAGIEAEKYSEEILQRAELTEEDVTVLGSRMKRRLDRAKNPPAQEASAEASTAEPDAAVKDETPEEALARLKGRYFALITEKHGKVHDADRREFQEKFVGKKHASEFDAADYEKAIASVQAGRMTDFIVPL